MGKSYTPPYRIEYRDQGGDHLAAWEHRTSNPWRGLGRPTDAKAEAWRKEMNASFQPGGSNDRLARYVGYVPHISTVRVIRQATGEVVARANMPMFEVV